MTKHFQHFSRRRLLHAALAAASTWLLPVRAARAADIFEQHYDGVLGTSLDVTIHGVAPAQAASAAQAMLADIARLEQTLSTFRAGSELMQLNAKHATTAASADLLTVLHACQQWQERSAGKFSCRLGSILKIWDDAEKQQVLPERPVVREQARALATAKFEIDATQRKITLDPMLSLEPSGLAKGYIIDRALASLRAKLPTATALKVDIGGDASYWGAPPAQSHWQVAVADPIHTADNRNFMASLRLHSKAIAASGHHSRTRTISRHAYSHVFNPRDGWPIENGTAAVVVANDAMTADAIATVLSVLPMQEGLSWVDSLGDDIAALVIDADGRQLASAHWADYAAAPNAVTTTSGTAAPATLTLDFKLPAPSVAEYNRPYVAIWISDAAQNPLKNLLLLGENERWARENARWWRRVGRRNPQLLDGVARPTRGPGAYQVEWDGLDDFGKPVPVGDYLLHVEASRENGGSTYKSVPLVLGSSPPQQLQFAADGELGEINLQVN
jgi:FAD:protein FMN transferase